MGRKHFIVLVLVSMLGAPLSASASDGLDTNVVARGSVARSTSQGVSCEHPLVATLQVEGGDFLLQFRYGSGTGSSLSCRATFFLIERGAWSNRLPFVARPGDPEPTCPLHAELTLPAGLIQVGSTYEFKKTYACASGSVDETITLNVGAGTVGFTHTWFLTEPDNVVNWLEATGTLLRIA